MSDLLIDHALTLLLADEPEAALRWGAAALQHDPSTPGALVVTSRLLEQMGRSRAAVDGLRVAVRRAIEAGNVALAIVAINDLRSLGVDPSEYLDQVASAFCRGSAQLEETHAPSPLQEFGGIQPLSPFLAGPSLASKASQILHAAKQAGDEAIGPGQPLLAPVPLFSALHKDALTDLLAVFEMTTVPAGHMVLQEGQEADAIYFVARGELEISRRAAEGEDKPRLVLSRIGAGAFFGEIALLGQLPVEASVRATRPSILLVARREAIAESAAKYPEAAHELAAHCRRHLVANLGWASPVVAAMPAAQRAMLVERLQTRLFAKGDMLINDREEAQGLHLIVSGEVAVVGHDKGERVVLATLAAGETVGEMELVLCRPSNADAIAVRPTATLFLPRHEFYALAQEEPAILHGLYGIAMQRHTETLFALDAGSAAIADEWMLEESTEIMQRPYAASAVPRLPGPRPFSSGARDATFAPPLSGQHHPVIVPQPIRNVSNVAAHVQRAAGVPSYAPTSASVPPMGQSLRSEQKVPARLTVWPIALIAAVAASAATVIGLRSRQADSVGSAARVATTSVAPSPPLTTMPTPAVARTAVETPTEGLPPLDNPAPTRAKPRAPGKPRRLIVERPPTTPSAKATASASATPVPSAMPKATPEPNRTASAAVLGRDEFGGRE